MQKISFKKFTTDFEIIIYDEIENLEVKIKKIITNFEMTFSRFLDNSEISRLNKEKSLEISSLFKKLFNLNIELYNLSNGYFNPFVNVDSIWYSWEISKNLDKKTSDFYSLFNLNWNKLVLHNKAKLDFWGSWKWFLVDLISSFIKNKWWKNYIVNFWGDIYVSWKNWNNDWKIGIDNPFLEGEWFWMINIKNKSISTSWTYKRNWEVNGKKYHHIINPKSQNNEFEVIMVSIVWKNTVFTDWIATSVLNMWIEKGLNFLNKNKIDWLIIWTDKKVYFSKDFILNTNFKAKW